MKARPMLFSGPMVRALLDGRKTQTRRVMKPQPEFLQVYKHKGITVHDSSLRSWCYGGKEHGRYPDEYLPSLARMCPYGKPGDLLWVRETWCPANSEDGPVLCLRADNHRRYLTAESYPVDYVKFPAPRSAWSAWAADIESEDRGWKPAIHMPRWASRLTLRITDVRVQRLHEITQADAKAEGAELFCGPTALDAFEGLWIDINGADSWAANPWVWAVTFEVIRENVDAVLARGGA